MTLFAILKKDLLLLLRDRGEMAVLFLLPLAFILPIGFALGGGDGYGVSRGSSKLLLPLADYDGGEQARALIAELEATYTLERGWTAESLTQARLVASLAVCAQPSAACDEAAARKLVAANRRVAGVIIPAGFSAELAAGRKTSLQMLYDPATDAAARTQAEAVLRGAAIKLGLDQSIQNGFGDLQSLSSFTPQDFQQGVAQQAGEPAAPPQEPVISLRQTAPSNYNRVTAPDTFQQTVPGYTVMYVFFLVGTVSGSIRDEKSLGTFRRLLYTPAQRAALLGGKLLAVVIVGLLQVLILFTVGVLAFGMQIGSQYAGLALMTVATVLAAVGIGAAAAGMKGGQALIPVLILSALVGGCMFPIDLMPPFLRTASLFVPHSWALTGFQDLMVRGQGLAAVLPEAGVLLAFAALFFFLAVRRFDFEE